MLDKYNVEYDMVQSEERQSVERLVMMMLNNGYKTIVIAGNLALRKRAEYREAFDFLYPITWGILEEMVSADAPVDSR